MLKHRKAHERQADINISIADSVLLDAYMDKTSFCHPESGHETDTRFIINSLSHLLVAQRVIALVGYA